jgi:hypothetical protein
MAAAWQNRVASTLFITAFRKQRRGTNPLGSPRVHSWGFVHNGDCASPLQDPHYLPCLADEVNGFAGSDYPELLHEPRNLTTAPSRFCHSTRPYGRQPCWRAKLSATSI